MAQQLYFSIPDKLKQIPSSESYKIMQDSKGYMWFSTEAGLCRFNGTSMQVFDKRNGLPEAAVYGIEEDRKGTIWIATSANRILCYVNDSLKEAPFSKNFQTAFPNALHLIYQLNIEDDTVFINSQHATYKAAMNSDKVERIISRSAFYYKFMKCKNFLLSVENGTITKKTSESILLEKQMKLAVEGAKTFSVSVPYLSSTGPSWRVITEMNKKKECFISFEHVLIKIAADGSYSSQQIVNPVISLYCDKDDGLWMGTLKGGVYYYKEGNISEKPVLNLAGFSVSGTCEDKEKGIWCTTLEKGVFYCRNKYIKSYPGIRGFEKKAELLKAVGNSVFVSGKENELVEIKNSQILYHPLRFSELYYISDILQKEDSTWLACGSVIIKVDKNFNNPKYVTLINTKYSSNAREIAFGPGKRIFALQTGELYEIKDETILKKCPVFFLGKCFFYPGEDYFLVGSRDGLYKINVSDFVFRKIPGVKGAVTKICSVAGNGTWVITKGNGLYILKNGRVFNMSDSLKLPTDRFMDITEDRYGTIWLGSNIGLIKIRNISGRYFVTVYTTLNGLPSNEIFNVAANDRELYLSTNEGICSFPLDANLLNVDKPNIIMNAVLVNGKEIPFSDGNLKLTYNENSIEVNLHTLTYKGTQALLYFLEGKNNTLLWGMSNGSSLLLNHIKAGKYELKIFGINNSKQISKIPVILKLEISKPFWRTTGFIFFCNIAICLVAFFTARIIIIRVRRKEEEKTRINKLIAEYQLSALRAQMNPHFIFNCINSIQRYILTNKPEEAYDYLSKFSKLIRFVLNYSEENMVTLTQELEILTLYLELEQLRLEHKFSYTVSIDESVNVNEVQIPPMMLQPYIENAIWHGLMNVKEERDKFITLLVKQNDSVLEIVIEDNGVGRKKAGELSSRTYQSKGTRINDRRIEMLNILGSGKGSIQTEDIIKDTKVSGTRVIINIPQQNYDE